MDAQLTLDYSLYAGAPPHVRHSTTSEAAAEAIAHRVNALHRKVLQAYREHPEGLTRDEAEVITGLSHQTCSARCRELVLKGLLVTKVDPMTGRSLRRPTRSGREAEVLFIADLVS